MFNRLIARKVTGTGAGEQHFVYDSSSPLPPGEGQGVRVLAFDGSGNLTDRYLWAPGTDQLLADENYSPATSTTPTTAGTTLWTLGDNQNTVRDLVNDSGTLVTHIAYTPFGQQLNSSYQAQVVFAFGYDGTYTDVITGDQLHGVRWYDPQSQRWITQDWAGLGPDSNPYRYCGNAPEDGTDPTGLVLEAIVAEAIKAFLEQSHNGHSSDTLDQVSAREVRKSINQLVLHDVQENQKAQASREYHGNIVLDPKSARLYAGTLGWDNNKTDETIEDTHRAANAGQLKIGVPNPKVLNTTLTWHLPQPANATATIDYTAHFDESNKLVTITWVLSFGLKFQFDFFPGNDNKKSLQTSTPTTPLTQKGGHWSCREAQAESE